ncbi:MAG TPA: 50S ribosomal protein L6 [Phycisphaerae bacterium]|nr:50S ribosomal protein L6 [Phycisphaerae bacterium]
MSRIGKKPIALPSGVKVDVKGQLVTVTGPKGSLTWTHAQGVGVAVDAKSGVVVTRNSDTGRDRALHGTTRALINNMVTGVSKGYEQRMEIYGTGYGAAISGKTLDLNVGYSNPIKIPIPAGLKVTVEVAQTKGDETPAKVLVSGIDKHTIGSFCRAIKDARKPEPYKGKGVRYEGEQIKRKAGKAFAGTGA